MRPHTVNDWTYRIIRFTLVSNITVSKYRSQDKHQRVPLHWIFAKVWYRYSDTYQRREFATRCCIEPATTSDPPFSPQGAAPPPFLEVRLSTAAGATLVDFAWNPGADFGAMFASCLGDGSVRLWEVKDALVAVAQLPPTTRACCGELAVPGALEAQRTKTLFILCCFLCVYTVY